ncbi:MAG: hypothetical protein LBU30_04550 [Candidatus Methanoplasma sp.]|nr:hypothetical protein [Candidatus Methanoplasma sp.]
MPDRHGRCIDNDNKVRAYIAPLLSSTLMHFEVMFNPECLDGSCDGRIHENRLCELEADMDGKECIHCEVLHTSLSFSREISESIMYKLKSRGIRSLEGPNYSPPSKVRYPSEIRF